MCFSRNCIIAADKRKIAEDSKIADKDELSVKVSIGDESMSDEQLAENIILIYNTILPKLPQEKNNLRYLAVKLTMGQLIKIGDKNVAQGKSR